ncbi:MAG: hypothetical protein MI784_01200 [Cytophagales bacterium]|nr:hypothetical protein [Cytophagales bacterium]
MKKKFLTLCMLLLVCGWGHAQRKKLLLNKNWKFTFGHVVKWNGPSERINLPHTWNNLDALGGNIDYYRGLGNYERKVFIEPEWKGKRLTLRFLGANSIANVFVNGKHVGEHRGGYTAFAFDISDFVNYGKENSVWVRVSNALTLDVMPLVGDFNFYGGIYRDVELYVTDQQSISLMDYGSKGVYLHQQSVSKENATVQAIIKTQGLKDAQLRLLLKNREGKVLQTKEIDKEKHLKGKDTYYLPLEILKPHLWNGKKDPYMYRVIAQVVDNGQVIDEVSEPLGLRYFRVDPDKGLFLNGSHLQVRGVCRHQDRPELGNALSKIHHLEDAEIMEEMGANGLRMSHYPHDPYMYDLMDEKGFVVWSEIPFVGPGGYRDKGFVNMESFKANGKQQLIEMIRQNVNHPSVLFWGLFNELKEKGDNPVPYLKELQKLTRKEDPYRITTAASNQNGDINTITDLIAWNKYNGWYGGKVSSIALWMDKTHEVLPDTPIGISEYGAGASLFHQQEELKKTNPVSYWHPENWQTHFHEGFWEAIDERPFMWGTFIWNLFDFGAAHRTEGEKPGKNDKGIVSFDRKDKKDSFYFYKANWNKEEPMVYIAERRLSERTKKNQTIKVYSNQKSVSLSVNGKKIKGRKGSYGRFYFEIQLKEGENRITAASGKHLTDQIELTLAKQTPAL